MQRLPDEDVDRIASRVALKLVLYGLVALLALWVVPVLMLYAMRSMGPATADLPAWLTLLIATAAIALPFVAVIWLWGRSRRAR